MMNLIGKVNKDNYTLFNRSDFSSYEVYLALADDAKYLPQMMERLNISSVHQPRKVDLCNMEKFGEDSYKAMRGMLEVLDSAGFVGTIVIHGNYFNERASNRLEHIKMLAKRVNSLLGGLKNPIKIAFETDVAFFNLIGSNRALLVSPDDFKILGSYLERPLNIVLDFEHIYISAIFERFAKEFPQFYQEVLTLADAESERIRPVREAWLDYLAAHEADVGWWVRESLEEFSRLNSFIMFFHINGTNYQTYWYDKKSFLPLVGEHLCLGEAADRLDYKMLKEYLPKLTQKRPIDLVFEIWPRGATHDEYHKESIKSAEFIKRVLC